MHLMRRGTWLIAALLVASLLPGQEVNEEKYRAAVTGIDISPGRWRPLFRTEHIAWVSPPWESQEYVSLDFPEAIFYDGELVFFEGSLEAFTGALAGRDE